jgi:hypothetical protein
MICEDVHFEWLTQLTANHKERKRGPATLNGCIDATESGPQVAFLEVEPRAARPE